MIHEFVGQAYNNIAAIFQPAAPKAVEVAPKVDDKVAEVAVAQIKAKADEQAKADNKPTVILAVQAEPKVEATKVEALKKDAPKAEVAKAEAPKVEPKVEATKVEALKKDAPKEKKPVEKVAKKKQIEVKQIKNDKKRLEVKYLIRVAK